MMRRRRRRNVLEIGMGSSVWYIAATGFGIAFRDDPVGCLW